MNVYMSSGKKDLVLDNQHIDGESVVFFSIRDLTPLAL